MKVELDTANGLYPLPVALVGATVNGKPNYIAIAHLAVAAVKHVCLSMRKTHYTNAGIKANATFSVNLPGAELVREADYCGLVSGRDENKAALFETFYGKLETAPMIEQCPLNMECRLVRTVDFPQHDMFIGEVVQCYCEENCLSDGVVDIGRVGPLLFSMFDRSYWRLGDRLAKAYSAGRGMSPPTPAV